jgi:hypothetical protein
MWENIIMSESSSSSSSTAWCGAAPHGCGGIKKGRCSCKGAKLSNAKPPRTIFGRFYRFLRDYRFNHRSGKIGEPIWMNIEDLNSVKESLIKKGIEIEVKEEKGKYAISRYI